MLEYKVIFNLGLNKEGVFMLLELIKKAMQNLRYPAVVLHHLPEVYTNIQ
jgi:hypothetical protein